MKKHLELQSLSPEQFRRLTGVKRKTFEEMVLILREEQNKRYRKAGRKGLLSLEDKLLMRPIQQGSATNRLKFKVVRRWSKTLWCF